MKKINVLAILVAVVIILSVPLCAFAEKADDANVVTEISENNIEQDNKSNNDVETKKVISTFKDVSYDTHSWAIDAIESMADQGLIKGYSDGTFKPDNTVSKLEALSLVARVLGVQDPDRPYTPGHNSKMYINEDSLDVAPKVFIQYVLDRMEN